jgi:hypothetical protein
MIVYGTSESAKDFVRQQVLKESKLVQLDDVGL